MISGKRGKKMIWFILIAVLAVLDLTVKHGIEAMPDEKLPRDIPGTKGKAQIRKLHNDGFPLGVFRDYPELVRCLPLLVTSVLTARLSLLLPKKGKTFEKLGLALTIGGAVSNLFDRFYRRYVVDYLHVSAGPLKKIIFNLGDVLIALGAVVSLTASAVRAAARFVKKG